MELIILFLGLCALAIYSLIYGCHGASMKAVVIEIIFAVGIPVILYHLYEIWFPEYYGGFIQGLGALVTAGLMIPFNLGIFFPLLNWLYKKLKDRTFYTYVFLSFMMIALSCSSHYLLLALLN